MKCLAVIITAVLLSPFTAASSVVAQQVLAPQIIRGDLLSIKGDTYVVKDRFGRFVILRVDKETKVDRLILPGAKIEAQVSQDGRALSIKRAN